MLEEEKEFCQYKKCGKPTTIIYLDKGLCEVHWKKIANMDTEKAWKLLKIKRDKNEQGTLDCDCAKEAIGAVESSNG